MSSGTEYLIILQFIMQNVAYKIRMRIQLICILRNILT